MVSIAFQAVDPGSIPGRRNALFVFFFFALLNLYFLVFSLVLFGLLFHDEKANKPGFKMIQNHIKVVL